MASCCRCLDHLTVAALMTTRSLCARWFKPRNQILGSDQIDWKKPGDSKQGRLLWLSMVWPWRCRELVHPEVQDGCLEPGFTDEFMELNGLTLICRAHQLVQDLSICSTRNWLQCGQRLTTATDVRILLSILQIETDGTKLPQNVWGCPNEQRVFPAPTVTPYFKQILAYTILWVSIGKKNCNWILVTINPYNRQIEKHIKYLQAELSK